MSIAKRIGSAIEVAADIQIEKAFGRQVYESPDGLKEHAYSLALVVGKTEANEDEELMWCLKIDDEEIKYKVEDVRGLAKGLFMVSKGLMPIMMEQYEESDVPDYDLREEEEILERLDFRLILVEGNLRRIY